MNRAESCLDAETLAAWVDGGLGKDELRMVETHVAGCARCQALVGAMARTEAAVPPAETQRAPRRWLAWVVPLTAAATALVIWAVVPRNTTTITPVATEAARPASPAASQPEVVVSPEVIPEKEQATAEKKAASPLPQRAAESRDQLSQTAIDATAKDAARQEARNDVAGAPAAAPAAPPAEAAAPQAARAAARALSENIAIPGPNIRALCGANWTGPAPAVTTPLNAGSSPTPNVCWIVGRLGVVLLTTDGRTWRGITFPVITDLSSVTATDARNATVVTADGRRFTTTDAGAMWMAR